MSKIPRRTVACLSALGALAAGAPAASAQDPVAGCPAAWSNSTSAGLYGGLWHIPDVMAFAQVDEATLRADDRNGDGYLCLRFVENFPPNRFYPAFVYTDNNVRAVG
jgi:hypothetical protein